MTNAGATRPFWWGVATSAYQIEGGYQIEMLLVCTSIDIVGMCV